MTYAETDRPAHYVTVRNGSRFGLLVGPFRTRQEAEPHVEAARKVAETIGPWARVYGFGTSRGCRRNCG